MGEASPASESSSRFSRAISQYKSINSYRPNESMKGCLTSIHEDSHPAVGLNSYCSQVLPAEFLIGLWSAGHYLQMYYFCPNKDLYPNMNV